MDAKSPCLKHIKKLIKNSQIEKKFFYHKKKPSLDTINRTTVLFFGGEKTFFLFDFFFLGFFICSKQGLFASTHVFCKKIAQLIKSRQSLNIKVYTIYIVAV